jgi:hypothetical protein
MRMVPVDRLCSVLAQHVHSAGGVRMTHAVGGLTRVGAQRGGVLWVGTQRKHIPRLDLLVVLVCNMKTVSQFNEKLG